jgi:oligoribonuclease NrnB/cAMP/cGMP phosphodiesterase (DHH superfamily)
MKPITVLSHGNCFDGFAAAYTARAFYPADAVEYFWGIYSKPIPRLPGGEVLLVTDFYLTWEQIQEEARRYKKIIVIDHHETAQKHLAEHLGSQRVGDCQVEIIFDMNHSGAYLTWKYFLGEASMPNFIKHISDRDTWKFEMENTKKFHAALVSYPMDFTVWDHLFTDQGVVKLIVEGPACKRYMDQLVQNIIQGSFLVKEGPYKIAIVNTTVAWSEVGESLLIKHPDADFSMTYTVHSDCIQMSLRSDNKNPRAINVAEYAERFGGGGHRNAAGFKVPVADLTRWLSF